MPDPLRARTRAAGVPGVGFLPLPVEVYGLTASVDERNSADSARESFDFLFDVGKRAGGQSVL